MRPNRNGVQLMEVTPQCVEELFAEAQKRYETCAHDLQAARNSVRLADVALNSMWATLCKLRINRDWAKVEEMQPKAEAK